MLPPREDTPVAFRSPNLQPLSSTGGTPDRERSVRLLTVYPEIRHLLTAPTCKPVEVHHVCKRVVCIDSLRTCTVQVDPLSDSECYGRSVVCPVFSVARHLALGQHDVNLANLLLQAEDLDVKEAADNRGNTPLHVAVTEVTLAACFDCLFYPGQMDSFKTLGHERTIWHAEQRNS